MEFSKPNLSIAEAIFISSLVLALASVLNTSLMIYNKK